MIELRRLTKRYGDQAVVDDVSLFVAEGELLAVLGASGSGKTTTLKMINRLIEPSSGSVHVNGEDVTGLPPHELRRQIGYAFQQVGLFPHMSVAEKRGRDPDPPRLARAGGPAPGRRTARAGRARPRGGPESPPRSAFGGQQQRVGVARALAARPA